MQRRHFPHYPKKPCPYCGRKHSRQELEERCQDKYEVRYDELEDKEAGDQRNWPENQRLMFLLMKGYWFR
jgi:DNA repair exonuclease SbcCD ATPase subunit